MPCAVLMCLKFKVMAFAEFYARAPPSVHSRSTVIDAKSYLLRQVTPSRNNGLIPAFSNPFSCWGSLGWAGRILVKEHRGHYGPSVPY